MIRQALDEGQLVVCNCVLAEVRPAFNVREAQIVQESRTRITVRVVRKKGYTDADTNDISKELRRRCGSLMEVGFDFVDAIPRTASGKFRGVISNVDAPIKYAVPGALRADEPKLAKTPADA